MTSEKPENEIDSVQLMRALREKIGQETEGMSYEEEREYIRANTKRSRTERMETDSPEDAA